MHTCAYCGVLLPPEYLYALCHDCRLLTDESEQLEEGEYDDIDIIHDENNNEHEHD